LDQLAPKQTNGTGKDEPRFSSFQQWLITALIGGVIVIFVWWSGNVNDSDKKQMEKLSNVELKLSTFIETMRGELELMKTEVRRTNEDLRSHLRDAYQDAGRSGASGRR